MISIETLGEPARQGCLTLTLLAFFQVVDNLIKEDLNNNLLKAVLHDQCILSL